MGKKLEHWEAETEPAMDGLLEDPDNFAPALSVFYRWLMAEHKRPREGEYALMSRQVFAGVLEAMDDGAHLLCKLAEREASGVPWGGPPKK